jgi:hypothetical protein
VEGTQVEHIQPAPDVSRVTRPSELFRASMRDLLARWLTHCGRLVDANLGIGESVEAVELAHDALEALACGQALTDRLMAARWVTVADALAYGALLGEIVDAMGLTPDEVAVGLRSWVYGQLREGLMTRARHDEVLALLPS